MEKRLTKCTCLFIVVTFVVIVCSCSDKKEYELYHKSLATIQSGVNDVDSLGTIWVVTIDNSGSMLKTQIGNRQQIATYVGNKLQQTNLFDNVNFSKDRFLFFGSGHLYNTKNVHIIKSAGDFDKSFIHSSDIAGIKLHSFSHKDDLIDAVKIKMITADFGYNLSFVSQIRVFSLVKAMKYLQKENLTKNFDKCKIVTITDDADQNDQWQTDYRNLKDYAPNMLRSINVTNVKYIYNQITSKGFGHLDEFFKCDSIKYVPHIWGYNYTTKQSLPENTDSKQYFDIIAFDGKNLTLQPLINRYKGNEILFFRLDSVIVNSKKHIVGKRFEDSLHIDLNYENNFAKNQFKVYGSFQVQYNDSIWGEHYKKYFYTQTEELPTAYCTATIHKSKNTALLILALFFLWIAVILPHRKLFVFYDNQGREFVVKRGWQWQWKSGIIPVLSYIFDNRKSEVIHKKSARIQQTTHDLGYANDDKFLIVSRYKITIPSTVLLTESDTKQDIEHFYINQSTKYKHLFENVYKKTPQYTVRKHLRETSNEKAQRLWKILLFVLNIFVQKRYYVVKKPVDNNNNNNIRFTFSKWKNKTFVVEIANKTSDNLSSIFKKMNTQCMNDYYENRHSAKSIIGIYKDRSWIYWTVLQPKYAIDHQNSLKFAYNIFQFKQKCSKETENQILENLKTLKQTVKNQTGRFKKVIYYTYDSLAGVTNKYDFEITETVCPGFLYLQETSINKDKTLIFSPFKDGLTTEKIVEVPKTKGSHLYLSFTMPSCLKDLDKNQTLWLQQPSDLITYSHKEKKYLLIKDVATGKQIILDPFSIKIQ